MTRARRLPAFVALALLAFALGACAGFPGLPETSTTLIVNKTTVPVSAEATHGAHVVEPSSAEKNEPCAGDLPTPSAPASLGPS